MPPAIIAAGIGAVGAIGGGIIASSSQKSAAKTAAAAQTQATDSQLQLGQQNIAFQQGIYDKNTALLSPFVQRGNAAGQNINALLGLGGPQAPAQATPQPPYPGFPYADPSQGAPASPQAPYPGFPYANQPSFQTASPYTQQPLASQGPHGARSPLLGFRGYPDNAQGGFQMDAYENPVQQNAALQQPTPANPAASPGTPAAQGAPANTSANDAFNQFANSAGMQFQLQQGTNALQNSAAARGLLQSGATLKALQNYGQNTALNNYFLPYLGLLQGQQATGAQSGAAIAGVGSNFGNTVSNIYGNQANAIQNGADATSNAALLRGQANAGLGNTIGSALGGLASSFANYNPLSGIRATY
jgi:hypothetical protein